MQQSKALRLLLVINIVGLSVLLVFVFDVESQLEIVLEWIGRHSWLGASLFIIIYAASTVLVVPASLFQVVAGAVFGLWTGSLVAWLGCSLGMVATFLTGRYLLRDWVKQKAELSPRWLAIEDAISEQGWTLVLLLRAAPFVPCCVLNYTLALTSVDLWTYVWASAVGILPMGFVCVYLGTCATPIMNSQDWSWLAADVMVWSIRSWTGCRVGRDVATIIRGGMDLPPTWILIMAIATVALVALAAVLMAHYANQAIERRLRQHMEDEDAAPGLDAAGSSAINGPATAEPLANGHREEVMSDSGGSKARAEGQASTMENGLRQPLLRAAEQSDP